MSSGNCIVLLLVILGLGTVFAAPAKSQPTGVRGKSIVVDGADTYQARRLGMTEWRSISTSWSMLAYFGTKGQTFTRVTTSYSSSQGVGANSKAHKGGRRSYKWSGSRLTVFASSTGGAGARRVSVQFGSGFKTCRATVVVAKSRGKRIVRLRRNIEVLASSWRTRRNAPCRVVNGNVFK